MEFNFMSCVIRYKDTNLKAIHNDNGTPARYMRAVSSDTKIQIWKQFTTPIECHAWLPLLCHPIQRYKFESNSQPTTISSRSSSSCVIRYKDTNLKAIHNMIRSQAVKAQAVSSDTKIQIWKQFTTKLILGNALPTLCHPIQRYKFESNSQRWQGCRRTRWAVSSDTKIQIWKQFTTRWVAWGLHPGLCHPIQRYKFESNSQRTRLVHFIIAGCVIRYKDTNLKAIHNCWRQIMRTKSAVSSDTKIQIWKQFTTVVLVYCAS